MRYLLKTCSGLLAQNRSAVTEVQDQLMPLANMPADILPSLNSAMQELCHVPRHGREYLSGVDGAKPFQG